MTSGFCSKHPCFFFSLPRSSCSLKIGSEPFLLVTRHCSEEEAEAVAESSKPPRYSFDASFHGRLYCCGWLNPVQEAGADQPCTGRGARLRLLMQQGVFIQLQAKPNDVFHRYMKRCQLLDTRLLSPNRKLNLAGGDAKPRLQPSGTAP